MRYGLNLDRISKSFGATRVLSDVSLSVEPGEFVSLVGPSGCGKSTLLRIIAGLERQDSGQVQIGGVPVDGLGPRARNIAMVFQNYALYPHMSAFDNVALPLTVSRLALLERLPLIKFLSPRRARVMREIAREVEGVAAQLKIEPLLARKPGQLSGGQRQRVALARAMVRKPSAFLMDEPLSNLDAQLRVHMRDELTELHARLGATFVYVTHDQIEAMTMSSRVAMLDGGRLAQLGTPAELYERPASLAVARFIGSPAINILPASVDRSGDLMLGGQPAGIALPGHAGAEVFLGIRPEHVHIATQTDFGTMRGKVRRNEHHGAERLLQIDLGEPAGETLVMRASQHLGDVARFGPGAPISLGFDKSQLHLFAADGLRLEAACVPSAILTAAQ